jgi:hypothetical protein
MTRLANRIRQRVAQAVEAGEVGAELLVELSIILEDHETRAATMDEEARLCDLAEMFWVTETQMAEALSGSPVGVEEFFEAAADLWLQRQRLAYHRTRRWRRHAPGA